MDWSIKYSVPQGNCLVNLPQSKSIAARAMMFGAFPDSSLVLCDDLSVLRDALLCQDGRIYVGSSGTALRFLTARFACIPGVDVIIDGTAQLRTRPVKALVDTLRSLGADISYIDRDGYAPLHIVGRQIRGGRVIMDASVSSQYVSALLLAAQFMSRGIEIVATALTSEPYIEMTCAVCREFGMAAGRRDNIFYSHYPHSGFSSQISYRIEADWSAASYFMEIAALVDFPVYINGLRTPDSSIQGDARSVGLFNRLGVDVMRCDDTTMLRRSFGASAIEACMRDMPDVVPALSVGCALRDVPFRLSGLETLRIKESNRIDVLKRGLRNLGFAAVSGNDWLEWNGTYCPNERTMIIDAFDDHRMVMAFAPAAVMGGVTILGAECVSKSFPDFESQISKCGFNITKFNIDAL